MSPEIFNAALGEEKASPQLAALARSIFQQESGSGKNAVTSNRGARGGMQVMPGTFKEVADSGWNIDDPLQNARAGIRYLKKMDKLSGGDPALTAAGYYGGPGGLEKARRGIAVSDPMNPKAPNTLQYGAQVAARMGKPQSGGKPSALPDVVPAAAEAVAQVPKELRPVDLAQASNVQAADVPVPAEALPAPAPVQQAQGPDPWQEFLKATQPAPAVAQAEANPFAQWTTAAAPAVPDFLGMLGRMPQARQIDFSGFGAWGA